MLKKTVKKIIKQAATTLGIDLTRFKEKPTHLNWLKEYEIGTFLDIGANVGQFAEEIRFFLPEAYIYSFEPIPACFQELEQNRHKDGRFKAFNIGLGEKEERLVMNVNAYSPSSSLLVSTEIHNKKYPHTLTTNPLEIQVRRLDDVAQEFEIKGNLAVKMDVQGYEDKIILGGRETLKKAQVVILELAFDPLYEGQPLFEDVVELLKPLGLAYHGPLTVRRYPNKLPLFEDGIFLRRF